MPSLSPLELLVVGVVALIVFGPRRLPQLARQVGRAMNELRRQVADLRDEFERGIDDEPAAAVEGLPGEPLDEPDASAAEPSLLTEEERPSPGGSGAGDA